MSSDQDTPTSQFPFSAPAPSIPSYDEAISQHPTSFKPQLQTQPPMFNPNVSQTLSTSLQEVAAALTTNYILPTLSTIFSPPAKTSIVSGSFFPTPRQAILLFPSDTPFPSPAPQPEYSGLYSDSKSISGPTLPSTSFEIVSGLPPTNTPYKPVFLPSLSSCISPSTSFSAELPLNLLPPILSKHQILHPSFIPTLLKTTRLALQSSGYLVHTPEDGPLPPRPESTESKFKSKPRPKPMKLGWRSASESSSSSYQHFRPHLEANETNLSIELLKEVFGRWEKLDEMPGLWETKQGFAIWVDVEIGM